MVDFFTFITPTVCVITCNTAHKRLSSYMNKKSELYKVFIDIRLPVFDYMNRIDSDFVITGTNGTTGVGLQKHEIGLYADHKQKVGGIKSQIIVNTLEQQDIIISAIVDIKAGQFDNDNDCNVCDGKEYSSTKYALMKKKFNPKQRILSIANEMRIKVGSNVPVVLGCTELPLPFSDMELEEHNLIDPTQLLGEYVKRKLV